MPQKLKPETKAKKYGYDQGYLKQNMVMVGVTFNKRKKDDMELLEWLDNVREMGLAESRVAYIKQLIQYDMSKLKPKRK